MTKDVPKASPPASARPTTHFASMSDDNWGSPPWIIDGARQWMGSIQLDPASDAYRNTVVKADHFLGLTDVNPEFGIPIKWGSANTIFVNPPGGVTDAAKAKSISRSRRPVSLAGMFWIMLAEYRALIPSGAFTWYCYNINQLQVLQRFDAALVRHCCVCIPDKRVQNLDRNGVLRGGTPSAAAILGYAWGDNETSTNWKARFRDAFEHAGAVWQA